MFSSKTLFFISFGLIFSISSFSQKIRFEYDLAGNQVQRKWCPTCPSKNNQNNYKDFSKIDENDLQKFFPEDIISYYPNPVKEELFLKWEIADENNVQSIEIYSINGQLIKSIVEGISSNTITISFNDYPIGIYFLNLNFINGDQKTIKIIKN